MSPAEITRILVSIGACGSVGRDRACLLPIGHKGQCGWNEELREPEDLRAQLAAERAENETLRTERNAERARVRELEEALAPFADIQHPDIHLMSGPLGISVWTTIENLQRARAAMGRK